jgi:hypothetical protein
MRGASCQLWWVGDFSAKRRASLQRYPTLIGGSGSVPREGGTQIEIFEGTRAAGDGGGVVRRGSRNPDRLLA